MGRSPAQRGLTRPRRPERSVACDEPTRRRAAEGALDSLQESGLLPLGPPVGRQLLRTQAQEILDAGQQLFAVEGLHHVLVGAQLPSHGEVALTRLGREEYDS